MKRRPEISQWLWVASDKLNKGKCYYIIKLQDFILTTKNLVETAKEYSVFPLLHLVVCLLKPTNLLSLTMEFKIFKMFIS